jgi:hypothetical protein
VALRRSRCTRHRSALHSYPAREIRGVAAIAPFSAAC